MIKKAMPNRYIKILMTFLRHWLDIKVTDRSKKEINVLGKWLQDHNTQFEVIVPDQTA